MKATLFAIMAGLCWAVGEFFTKQVLHTGRIGPITAITIRSTVALPIMWLVYLTAVHMRQLEPTNWMQADRWTLAKLVFGSGLVAGAGGMIFFYASLHLAPISRVKPIAFTLAPGIAVLLGWFFLHEPMSARKVAALVLILLGVVMLTGE